MEEIDKGSDKHSPTESILFTTSLEDLDDAPLTRAVGDYAVMEMTEWEDGDDFTTRAEVQSTLPDYASVYAYQYAESFNPGDTTRLMYNVKFQFSDEGTLEPVGELKYWSSLDKKKKVFFCSYAPYYEGTGKNPIQPTVYPDDATGNPGVTYTVPTDVKDQTDILYASAEVAGDYKQAVPFKYRHALTAIQFKMGFACTVKSISIENVNTKGTFTFAKAASSNVWEESDSTGNYTVSFGEGVTKAVGDMLVDGNNTMMLIPQTFADDATAKVVLVYDDGGTDKTISASLAGSTWRMGKKIVYTLYNTKQTLDAIYFDLAAGPVTIDESTYSGKIYVGGTATEVSGTHDASNKYYVYQSSANAGAYDKDNTGYETEADMAYPEKCRIPDYPQIAYEGRSWDDYITDNTSLKDVSTNWDEQATAVGRTSTVNKIKISGNLNCDLTIDNLWIVNKTRSENGAIAVISNSKSSSIIRLKGDNRLSQLRYITPGGDGARIASINKNNTLILTSIAGDGHSDGSITAGIYPDVESTGNYWDSVIGGTDARSASYGLTINGGTIYAAAMQNENCTAIGGGGNGVGGVFINGGKVTAVTQGTAAAIGGGIGYSSLGGNCRVDITGGEVYAYNLIHDLNSLEGVPAAAIGGGSSVKNTGNTETFINISGGNIYAESASGVGIGGGGSAQKQGGPATITISGGKITAKSVQGSVFGPGVAIGGGPSGTSGDGGTVTLNISGSPVINTGSIGGGASGNTTGKVGSAQIKIEGSPVISGQFIMAAGASTAPTFEMTGGTVQNSKTTDADYVRVQENGGAVYMEDGTCTISGGTIKNCTATLGGAIYMNGGEFKMEGGALTNNHSESHGGAVYVSGGNVTVTGGTVTKNHATNGNGGAIYVTGGSFSMPSGSTGSLTYNAANTTGSASNGGNGGAIYVASTTNDVSAEIISGTVTNNTADLNGGGMCVDMSGGDKTATITIGKNGGGKTSPNISSNSATFSGGALCVLGANSNVTINSGTVRGNVSAYQKNQDIRNDGGMVTLTTDDCDVDYKTVTFHSNNGSDETAVQRIVTNTNSLLSVPSTASGWTYEFHTFSHWNTSKYGTGTTYTDGQLMNIDADINVYAIWKEN